MQASVLDVPEQTSTNALDLDEEALTKQLYADFNGLTEILKKSSPRSKMFEPYSVNLQQAPKAFGEVLLRCTDLSYSVYEHVDACWDSSDPLNHRVVAKNDIHKFDIVLLEHIFCCNSLDSQIHWSQQLLYNPKMFNALYPRDDVVWSSRFLDSNSLSSTLRRSLKNLLLDKSYCNKYEYGTNMRYVGERMAWFNSSNKFNCKFVNLMVKMSEIEDSVVAQAVFRGKQISKEGTCSFLCIVAAEDIPAGTELTICYPYYAKQRYVYPLNKCYESFLEPLFNERKHPEQHCLFLKCVRRLLRRYCTTRTCKDIMFNHRMSFQTIYNYRKYLCLDSMFVLFVKENFVNKGIDLKTLTPEVVGRSVYAHLCIMYKHTQLLKFVEMVEVSPSSYPRFHR